MCAQLLLPLQGYVRSGEFWEVVVTFNGEEHRPAHSAQGERFISERAAQQAALALWHQLQRAAQNRKRARDRY